MKRARRHGEENVITVASTTHAVRTVAHKILAGLAPYRLNDEAMFDIKLCIEEAVRNAVVHGNHADTHLTVTVRWHVTDGVLTIAVEDQGAGFDHAHLPDPTKGENIARTSGRGVYLIRHLMDAVVYNHRGNTITMTRRLS